MHRKETAENSGWVSARRDLATEVIPNRCMSCVLKAVIAIGACWLSSERLRAVTTISSNAEVLFAAELAAA